MTDRNDSEVLKIRRTAAASTRELHAWMRAHETELIAFLRRIVDMDTATEHRDGVEALAQVMSQTMADIGFDVERREVKPPEPPGTIRHEMSAAATPQAGVEVGTATATGAATAAATAVAVAEPEPEPPESDAAAPAVPLGPL